MDSTPEPDPKSINVPDANPYRNPVAIGCALAALLLAGYGWWLLYNLQTQLRIASGGNDIYMAHYDVSLYARDHDGLYPPMDDSPGRLMFDVDVMYPAYCKNANHITADSDPTVPIEKNAMRDLHDTKAYIDDHSYFYLGYIVSNETELLALAEAYRSYAQRGELLPDEISVAEGEGSFGSGFLLRLREPEAALAALAEHGMPEAGMRARLAGVPVFIERLGHYRKDGGWVEFLDPEYPDGRAEFVEYPGKFPMTRACIEALTSLDALESDRPPPKD